MADNLGVGETNDKTVLGGLVLVLVLGAKTLTLTVIGLSLASTTELDLEPREVGFVLLGSDENLNTNKIKKVRGHARGIIELNKTNKVPARSHTMVDDGVQHNKRREEKYCSCFYGRFSRGKSVVAIGF